MQNQLVPTPPGFPCLILPLLTHSLGCIFFPFEASTCEPITNHLLKFIIQNGIL